MRFEFMDLKKKVRNLLMLLPSMDIVSLEKLETTQPSLEGIATK